MPKTKLKNLFWTAAALFCATQFCSAQSSDIGPTVEAQPPRPAVALPNSDSDLTMAGEYKSNKQVVEQEKPVCDFNFYFEGGYTSEYIFRDTTVGNIAFFIQRTAQTSFDATGTNPITGLPFNVHFRPVGGNTVQDERFDRLYVSLSTSKIPYVTPKITYYQTVYSEGSEPFT